MSIIVDGYNYIGRSHELKLDDPTARDKVIYLMGQYCGRVKKTLTLVFDGNYFVHHVNRKRRYGRVTVIYTSPIYTADHAIKKMIKNQENRRRQSMLVVSSDNDILEYAKLHGTQISKSEDFEILVYQKLAEERKIDRVNVRITEEEVQEWLKIFGPDASDTDSHHESPSPGKATSSSGQQPQSRQQPVEKGKKSQHKVHSKKHPKKKSPSSQSHDGIDRVHVHLSSREIREWMDIFGVDEDDE